MGQPAAKKGDQVMATDIHIVLIPTPGGPVPMPLPNPFTGILKDKLSDDVKIESQPAATVDSIANNNPPHIPQGGPFQKPPSNKGKIITGSSTVKINGKAAARNNDKAETCNDPADLPNGTVIATGTVLIG